MSYMDDPVVEELANALQMAFGDVDEDDEWDQAFRDMADHLAVSPAQRRRVEEAWREVLARRDGKLAAYLVENWALQGTYEGEEALGLLQQWYDRLEPTWKTASQ